MACGALATTEEKHLFTLSSMANLALTYRNQGQWKEAEEPEVQVIDKK
jgi:Tetratricopeptide repeat